MRRILALAEGRGDAGHHSCRDALDTAGGRTVDMSAENRGNPPGVLQNPLQPRHDFPCFEVQRIRPHRNLEWRVVGEHCTIAVGAGLRALMSATVRAKSRSL
jgi:hypothetical protein